MKKTELIAEIEKLKNMNMHRQDSMQPDINVMLQNAVDASGEIIYMTDTNGIITYINPEFTKVYGYSSEEVVGKTTPRILKSGKMDPSHYDKFWDSLVNKKIVKQEMLNMTKDGNDVLVEGSANAITDCNNNIIGFLAIQRDITEKKATEERLRYITDSMHDLVCQVDLNARYRYTTPSYSRVLGYTPEELNGSSIFLKVHPDDVEVARAKFDNAITTDSIEEVEVRVKNSKGQYIWLHSVGSLMHDNNGKVTGVIVSSREVTERKKVEEELHEYQRGLENTINERTQELRSTVNRLKNEILEREQIEIDLIRSREEFKTLADNLPDIIMRYDKNLNEVYSNTRRDFSAILSNSLSIASNGPGRNSENANLLKWNSLINQTFETGIPQKADFELIYEGERKYYETQTVPERSNNNNIESVLIVLRDLTERKKIETAVQFALAEKEVLLREIHHRVKNNLQSIIYLIDMQIEDSSNSSLISSLKDLQFKVKTMSIVHEQLYKSKNLSSLDFEDYLKSLLSNLYSMFGSRQTIEIKYDTTERFLDIETVLPCGMIINELITNSIKYAFPENFTRGNGWQPMINVNFKKNEGEYLLSVEDNGIGLPSSINWKEADSLGLKLVNIWATYQLNGSLEVNNKNGTRFEIKFKKGL